MRAFRTVLVSALLVLPLAAQAQTVTLSGTVADSATAAALPGARVEAIGAGGPAALAVSDGAGRFRLTGLAGGRYALVVERVGYVLRRIEDILVVPPEATQVSVRLAPVPISLDPIVITVSRSSEPALDAPASVSVVDRRDIQSAVAFTPVDHVRAVPGMDFASKGLLQHTFAVRGSRRANSAALLMLTDHRYARLPSIGFNVPYLVPASSDDLDRIEVTRGPSAALYGPNSYQGVLHLVTRSPLESQGTAASLVSGSRSVLQGSVRHAVLLGERVGFKLSGEYFGGEDWPFVDSVESRNRQQALLEGADPDTLGIGRREPRIERAAGEARVDWRPDDETTVVGTAGVAQAIKAVDLTPDVGAVQVLDWRYSFVQARANRGRLFANVTYNWSDAGETYQLRTGARLVDDSRVVAAQVQHSTPIAGRHHLLYGLDVHRTDPRTAGTIHGRNEDDDAVTEVGAYLHETTVLGPKVDLVAALRADYHDRIADFALSPRAAVVVRPALSHALRLTYNRAFNSPDASDLFVDIVVDSLPLPFAIRRFGTGERDFTLSQNCGGLCMYSPFTPLEAGGPAALLPQDATLLWPAMVAVLGQQGIDLSGIPAPSAAQVGTDLKALDVATGSFQPVFPPDLTSFPAHRRTITNAVELGYKGVLGDHILVGLDVHRTRVTDLLGGLFAATPNVFLNEGALEQYLVDFLPAESARAVAAAAATIPVGTISSEEAGGPDILLLRRQGGAVTLWGADLTIAADLTPSFSAGASYSWVSDDSITNVSQVGDFVPSAPRHKGAVQLAYRNASAGVETTLQARAVSSFPVESGVYRGRVESYEVLDVHVGYRLPWAPTLDVALDLQNALDNRHQEYVGAPLLGRLAIVRVRATF
jgi:outer membrane receptor for ferrienterochelin and colicins